jgi:hypothetical protein
VNTLTRKGFAASVSATLTTTVRCALAAAAPAPADDIRDIRPLISIPPWWYWVAAGVAVALLSACIFAGIRYWRRRSRRALTPEQKAQEALAKAEVLARDGQCREWADVVAQTLRTARAARLGHDACPETTSELAALEWTTIARGTAVDGPRLVELLSTCDLTRFALGRLDPSALLVETQSARDWVKGLFAAPEPATSTATQASP